MIYDYFMVKEKREKQRSKYAKKRLVIISDKCKIVIIEFHLPNTFLQILYIYFIIQ